MATDSSIEAARNRIQKLVEEIAALSKQELPSGEYFQQFLDRVVAATDAKGGAIWLVGSRPQDNRNAFQLCAQVEFDSSLFRSDETQRTAVLKILTGVVQKGRSLVLSPSHLEPADAAPAAAAAAANKTPYPFLHVPLRLKEQAVGVLQVWLQPFVRAENFSEFATFLSSLVPYVEQHLQSRRLGNLVLETQRLQHLLRFTDDIAGSLESLEVARLTASHARDLLGCERASVLLRDADGWRVLAISGQESVEARSAMVKAMTAFVAAHCAEETRILSKKELLDRATASPSPSPATAHAAASVSLSPGHDRRAGDATSVQAVVSVAAATAAPATAPAPAAALASAVAPARTPVVPGNNPAAGAMTAARRSSHGDTGRAELEYFELSPVVSAVICPLLDREKRVVGALLCESTFDGYFDGTGGQSELMPACRLAGWIAAHAGRALLAARDYETLPFLPSTRRLRAVRHALTGERRRGTLFRSGLIAAAVLLIALWPLRVKVEGDCFLQPLRRATVVPEITGRIENIHVREGDRVKAGDALAQLDTRRLRLDLAGAGQEKKAHLASADRLRAAGDEAGAQIALLRVNMLAEQEKRLLADIESATLRAPMDGVVMTKDLELRAGEVLQTGAPFAEIAGLNAWELHAEINERDIAAVEKALEKRRAIRLDYILYSQASGVLHATIADRRQISMTAFPREHENVFLITIENPPIPEALAANLRPGLTGRAKLLFGHRPLAWVWAGGILRWFRHRMIGWFSISP